MELFDQLVLRYRDALIRVAQSKLGDRNRAEDVVQDAFLAAYTARQTYKPEFAFRTWLWTILLNLCRRDLKRRSRRPAETAGPLPETLGREWTEAEPTSDASGLNEVLVAERNAQLAALLLDLPEVQADALRLRFFGQLKFQEIADAMGSSLGAAKTRVRKGLQALSERLHEREDDSHEL